MKTALKHDGEIICADSRTVYRGLDIGTAKPSKDEQRKVPHHVLDIVEPDKTFSAGKFQRLANAAIEDIRRRGKLPIMAGGTGLFVDGVLFNYEFGAPADVEQRANLEQNTVKELQNYCIKNNIELPNNLHNKRHLIRTIEQQGTNRNRTNQLQNAFVVGISPEKETLQQRIQTRAKTMLKEDVVNEATKVAETYGWGTPGLSGNVYPIIHRLVEGEISDQEAMRLFAKADWQLARRQMTWFRRNKNIHWRHSAKEVEQLIEKHLANPR